VFQPYQSDFDEIRARGMTSAREMQNGGSRAVLGLPLLAHLAVRLIAQWVGDRSELLANPTMLYRSIVDLTCEKGGTLDGISIESLRE
jgi:hypothetical protein